jgi:hypothetical protein
LPVSDWMAGMEKWQDIQSVVEVTRKRTFKKKGKEHIEDPLCQTTCRAHNLIN